MMKENLPPPVSGTDFESAYHNRVRQNVKQARILPGPGYRVKQFAGGTAIEIIPRGGGRGAQTSLAVYEYAADQNPPAFDDYVLGYPQKSDGTFDLTQPTPIAKPWRLRNSVQMEAVGAIVYNFVYDSTTFSRTATWTGSNGIMYSELQVIVPPWLTQEVILAAKVSNTGVLVNGADVGWMDLNVNAMAWMRKGSLP